MKASCLVWYCTPNPEKETSVNIKLPPLQTSSYTDLRGNTVWQLATKVPGTNSNYFVIKYEYTLTVETIFEFINYKSL